MNNAEYWKLRFEQLEQAQNQKGVKAYADIERQYKEAQKQLEGQIARWYQRFATNNGISLAEARQYLKGADLKEFKWDVQEYIKYGQENALNSGWMKELENASAKYHISKLEALKVQTQHSLEVMYAKQFGTMHGALSDAFESGYYHTAYELQHGFNVGWDIAGLDQAQIEKVLAKPWAADGYNFSERIWGNKNKLISEVHNELSRNIMLGADPQKAIDSLAKKMNTSKNNAGRLVMTEEAYFSSAAQKDCFESLGVEQYEIVATLDSHTSDICRSLDGKHFPMKDYQPGVTAPPFHVYCRSTTVPYFDEQFDIGERAARDEETGKTYYIPDDMNYQEWKETFVDGGNKSGFDVLDDGSALHYTHHEEPEPLKPKKEYLTKKKLQAKIADADVQLEDLEAQFKGVSGGWTFDEVLKDFGSLEDFTDGDDLAKLKDLHSQVEAIEAQKAEWQQKLNEKLIAEQKGKFTPKNIDVTGQRFNISSLNFIVLEKIADGEYQVQCETPGIVGNQQLGTMIPIEYIEGLETAELTGVLIPGEDEEDTEDLRKRYFDSFNEKAFGGNVQDYLEKTNAIPGVGSTKVTRVWNGDIRPADMIPTAKVKTWYEGIIGTLDQEVALWLSNVYMAAAEKKLTTGGTVLLTILNSDYGVASDTLIQTVQNTIDPAENAGEGYGLAPIGHVVSVKSAKEVTVTLKTKITFDTGYSWSNLQNSIDTAVQDYLLELRKGWADTAYLVVRISQIETRLLSIKGIVDIENTKINGSTDNLTLGKYEVPVFGGASA